MRYARKFFLFNLKWDTSVIKNSNPFKNIVDNTMQYKEVQRFQFYKESGVNQGLGTMFFIIGCEIKNAEHSFVMQVTIEPVFDGLTIEGMNLSGGGCFV